MQRDAILGLKAPSLFYALLINRVQFQTESGQDVCYLSSRPVANAQLYADCNDCSVLYSLSCLRAALH